MKKKLLFLFFVICSLLFISCGKKETKDNVLYTNGYTSQWILFDEYFNLSDYSVNKYTSNDNSYFDTNYFDSNNKAIYLLWDGKKAKELGGDDIGKNSYYFGFNLSFNKNKDFTEAGYNRIYFNLKGKINENHLLKVVGFSDTETKYIYTADIDVNNYKEFYIDINSNSLKNVTNIIGFSLENKEGIFSDLSSGQSYILIDKILIVKKD